MPLDDRLRTGLKKIADEIEPDVERGIERTLAKRSPSPARRATALLAYAAAIGLGIAVVGLGASSMLNRVGTNPSPTAPTETTSPSCRGHLPDGPLSSGVPNPLIGSCLGKIELGVGRSQNFIPPIDYVIQDKSIAWDNPEDLPGTFTLHPAGPETDAIFFFRDVRVTTAGCDSHVNEAVGNRAAEIAAWMAANRRLTTTAPRTVALGGLRGVQLDLSASGTYTTLCSGINGDSYPAGLPLVPLFAGAGSGDLVWRVGGGERMRLYVLDMPGGGNLVISVDAIAGDFDRLLEVCLPVIDSITFDPDYY
jgi:hypothetical protein